MLPMIHFFEPAKARHRILGWHVSLAPSSDLSAKFTTIFTVFFVAATTPFLPGFHPEAHTRYTRRFSLAFPIREAFQQVLLFLLSMPRYNRVAGSA